MSRRTSDAKELRWAGVRLPWYGRMPVLRLRALLGAEILV
jgi:hypothetical protein